VKIVEARSKKQKQETRSREIEKEVLDRQAQIMAEDLG
jgi:hypothetical protein